MHEFIHKVVLQLGAPDEVLQMLKILHALAPHVPTISATTPVSVSRSIPHDRDKMLVVFYCSFNSSTTAEVCFVVCCISYPVRSASRLLIYRKTTLRSSLYVLRIPPQ